MTFSCTRLVAMGDSLTYGQDESDTGIDNRINGASQKRSLTPYPETLDTLFDKKIEVLNHGFPGDRSIDGLVRWQSDIGDIFLIMYGTNDAFNGGKFNSGTLSPFLFKRILSLIVESKVKRQEHVLLIPPPPVADLNRDKILETYRDQVRAVGRERGIPLLDIDFLRSKGNIWTDGTHLTAEANRAIAEKIHDTLVYLAWCKQ